MSTGFFQFKRALQVYGYEPGMLVARGIDTDSLPDFARSPSDNRQLKSWSLNELPKVGARLGFMPAPKEPLALAVFVTKGGVLKSSLTLNFARMAALSGLRTCVVGLDMQGDISGALSTDEQSDPSNGSGEETLEEALAKLVSLRGLADIFAGQAKLDDVICATDIPTLSYIPETPELVALDQSLVLKNRREYWLRDHVIEPLKNRFDLVIMDCSPNWNRLITNALVAADVLLTPVECKINNFRNLKTFRALISEFRADMKSDFKHVYVATRLSPARKLSREIFDWYRANLKGCAETAIRESIQGEEAMALKISIPEYAPVSAAADEMRTLINEVWSTFERDAAPDLRKPQAELAL